MLSGEATNTNFIVFGLTRSRLEPTIYRSRGEPANYYTILQRCGSFPFEEWDIATGEWEVHYRKSELIMFVVEFCL